MHIGRGSRGLAVSWTLGTLSVFHSTAAHAQLDAHHILQPVVLSTTEAASVSRTSACAAGDIFAGEAIESTGSTLVEFWSSTCLSCSQVAPLLREVVDSRQGTVKLIRVDARLNPDVALDYGIKVLPAVAVFRDGRLIEVVRFPAGKAKEKLTAALDRQFL